MKPYIFVTTATGTGKEIEAAETQTVGHVCESWVLLWAVVERGRSLFPPSLLVC